MFEDHKTRPLIEIQTTHPYMVRSTITGEICEEFIDKDHDNDIYIKIPTTIKDDYERVLNVQKKYIIAEHFVPNIDRTKFRIVVQCDGNKLNFNPDNLTWATPDEIIARKVQRREYIDALPEDSIKIKSVGEFTFNHYYYSPSNRSAYLITRSGRIQKVSSSKRGNSVIMTFQDILGISRGITLTRLIKSLNL